jgi:hypothetical protein
MFLLWVVWSWPINYFLGLYFKRNTAALNNESGKKPIINLIVGLDISFGFT